MRYWAVSLCLALAMGVAGCADQQADGPQSQANAGSPNSGQPVAEQPAGGQTEANQPAAEPSGKLDVQYVKEHLKTGLTQEDVKKLFGSSYTEVKAAMDDSDMWRFDIGAQEGYQSPDDQYDTVDVEGIKTGKLEMILFVGWGNDGTVETFSLYYKNKDDGRVYDYRVMPNGQEKEQAIT
ncbi:MAG: hypothetical protein H0Z34_07165 [Brevibacillus sp.]|nr:hypothetical protein [Brevibacillus sp.]